ncbi:MAG: prolyl oligopeptidase family serine peptidase [Deltaproteobacteria bacterium]|nr:prolyl oligopeptidase family serine peptidase [Deltaproteobacteria bacterium]
MTRCGILANGCALVAASALFVASCGDEIRARASASSADASVRPSTRPTVAAAPPSPPATSVDGPRIAIGPEGMLSTWRLLSTSSAPPPSAGDAGTAAPAVSEPTSFEAPPRPGSLEAFAVGDRETLDLERVVGPEVTTVRLGAELHVRETTRVHLLVGAAGDVTGHLDDVIVLSRSSRRYRHDDALARLSLSPGRHVLVLRLSRPANARWRLGVRWLDARFRPRSTGVRISVGALDDETMRRLSERAARIEERRAVGPSGLHVTARVSFPGGGPMRAVTADVAGAPTTLTPSDDGVWTASAGHTFEAPARGDLARTARVESRTEPFGRDLSSDVRVANAAVALRAALASASERSHGPLQWRIAELERIVADGDRDEAWRRVLVTEATSLARRIDATRDPFADPRGYVRMGFRSRIDDSAQTYELFVPPAYRREGSTRAWPLVVTLHGFEGNAGDYFRNTLGLPRPPSQSLEEHGRHGQTPRDAPMIVMAPTARGQTHYRYVGESDVHEAMADVRARFRIDPERIYVTGGSMGGTGAAYLPFRNPDLFAASIALAGYHDQRVRNDTRQDALAPWEQFLRAARSDVDWAENALHLPMLLVRGTRDRPLAWTRSLVTRLRELGYRHEHREPALGHNVWTETYRAGGAFRWFARHRRPVAPERVRLRTGDDRHRRAWWVTIDERVASDAFAEVDARVDATTGAITVRTEGTAAFTMERPPSLASRTEPMRAIIDGAAVTGPPPLRVRREGASWALVPTPSREPSARKRPGVSGPIRDVFHDALVFVVGTRDPDHELVNRLVAHHWAHPVGWDVHYPIVRDADVTEEMIRTRTLVLVGPPRSNALLARWASQLPIRIDARGIVVGAPRPGLGQAHRFDGDEVGTVFVAPCPDAPDRSVLVIAGPTPLGTWRSTFLPDILPDYVVFDARIAPARDRWAAGGTGAQYLTAGFFDPRWRMR